MYRWYAPKASPSIEVLLGDWENLFEGGWVPNNREHLSSLIVTENRWWKPLPFMACENNNPEWHKLLKIQKRTYIRTTLLLLMVHLGKGFFNHFCFLTHSVSIFFSAVSYPPSTRTVCNLSVSFLTKRMSIKLSTKFTQRSDVIPCLDKDIKQWKSLSRQTQIKSIVFFSSYRHRRVLFR